MNEYGVSRQAVPRDPFGLAYSSAMRIAAPPVQRAVVPPIAEPIQVPIQRYVGLPRLRERQFPMLPIQAPTYVPQNRVAASPLQPNPGVPSIDAATLTDLIRRTESSGNYQALNRDRPGNTASGAYQYTDPTWNNYGGYAKAMYAPREVQDRRFAEDIAARYKQHGGDPFRIIAAHNLPAYADNPEVWEQPITLPNGAVVPPLATYIRKVIKGSPLEGQFDAYLRYYGHK